LPAVVGCGATILECKPGTKVALDGGTGEVWFDPDAEIVAGLEAKRSLADEKRRIVHSLRHDPSVTRDGKRVEVLANIGSVEDARVAMDAGAEGVGLLRTEFLYLGTERPPAEEDQVAAYRAIIDVFRGLPVVLRTLDIGGDKGLPYLDLAPEANPFLRCAGSAWRDPTSSARSCGALQRGEWEPPGSCFRWWRHSVRFGRPAGFCSNVLQS
jgi:phosphocarrier protein FPr